MAKKNKTTETSAAEQATVDGGNGVKQVVLIGLGYVHLHLLKRLSKLQTFPFEITLITEHLDVPVKTMIPDFIAGFCRKDSVKVSAEALVEKLNIKVIRGSAIDVDTRKNKVKVKSDQKAEQLVGYDFVSINCGVRPNASKIKGAEEFAHFNKPIRAYQKSVMTFCDALRGRRKITVVQVGSDHGGLESVLSLIRRLKAYGTEASIHLVEAGTKLMPNHPRKVSSEMLKIAEANKIILHLEKEVVEVQGGSLTLSDGVQIPSDFTSVALPLEAAGWLKSSGLKQHNGLIRVNTHLQASEHNVFAVGSVAVDPEREWPRSHRAAFKQAKVLFQNLKASALGTNLKKYRPSAKELEFICDGDGKAMITRGNLVFNRRPFFWNWKVKRDQKFQNYF